MKSEYKFNENECNIVQENINQNKNQNKNQNRLNDQII
jgi:hypothetical protein